MAALLYVNDVDLADLGVEIGQNVEGWRDGPEIRPPSAPLLGRVGRLALTDSPSAAPRVISLDGVQTGTDAAQLLSRLDQLKRLLYDGIVRVRPADLTDREFLAIARLTTTPIGAWLNMEAHSLRLRFDCDDPLARAITPTLVNFQAAATATMLGTAVSPPVIRIGDSVTNPVVTYRDSRGQVIQTMGFTITIASGNWIEIDTENQTVVDQAGAQQAGALTSGDFIELNPYHGGGISGPWPTLELSGGGLAQAQYRKRWL